MEFVDYIVMTFTFRVAMDMGQISTVLRLG